MPKQLLYGPLTVRLFAEEISPTPKEAAFSGYQQFQLPPDGVVIRKREAYRQCNRHMEAKQLT